MSRNTKLSLKNCEFTIDPILEYIKESSHMIKLAAATTHGLKLMRKETKKENPKFARNMEKKMRAKYISGMKVALNQEIEQLYPSIYLQVAILNFDLFEAAIKNFIIAYFTVEENLEEIEEIRTVQIALAEYEGLNEEERVEYLFKMYEENVTHESRNSLKRIEALLRPLGLGGDINEEIKRDFWEYSHIRYCMLRKAGIADKYFVKNCPHLHYKKGDKIRISYDDLVRYIKACLKYSNLLILRLAEHIGIDLHETTFEPN